MYLDTMDCEILVKESPDRFHLYYTYPDEVRLCGSISKWDVAGVRLTMVTMIKPVGCVSIQKDNMPIGHDGKPVDQT